MVCKEDVLTWFKDLECYKRVDVMHDLLNMCLPYEIRFIGTCVEEMGKQSYQELCGHTSVVNDAEKLAKDSVISPGLLDETARSRVVLYLSLLSSKNYLSANWIFNRFRTELEECINTGNVKDDSVQSELLLLLTIGLHHPAFTFYHKTNFARLVLELIEQREEKKNSTFKPHVCYYPPGLGYPTAQNNSVHADIRVPPLKPMAQVDSSCQQLPPVLPMHTTSTSIEYMHPIWCRPTFSGNNFGAPEVPPFPPPSISPMVSQPTSPPSSRTTSPPRTYMLRSMAPVPPTSISVVELPQNAPLTMESLAQTGTFIQDIKSEPEMDHIPEEKVQDLPWMNRFEFKQPNGFSCQPNNKRMSYLIEQVQALKMEGENSLHCSASSSNSSLNQSPPQTPSAITAPPHGPGRGDAKCRVNGIPFIPPPTGPNICESTPPPPFSNCTVPYSSYQIPPLAPNSVPSRNLNCYNCGALGHVGSDCSAQTIEDITQKAYIME